jgi:glycosyltransferase involved in cell wall biosynthesis
MRVLVVSTHIPFVHGGAELLAENLVRHMQLVGNEVELVKIPFKSYPPPGLLDSVLANSLLDLSAFSQSIDRCVALKFPAYLVQHPSLVVWLIHQHRQAYDLWDTPFSDLRTAAEGAEVRDVIKAADRKAFGAARKVFTIAQNVTERLLRYNGFAATTLYHPPPLAGDLQCAAYEDFLFYPSRLNPSKRQTLVLQALALTQNPVTCIFAGAADHPNYASDFRADVDRLGLSERVQWLGQIDDPSLVDLYARARAIVFTPFDEDYGYVTLEAMLSHKSVITLTDAGGPTEFIDHDQQGLVVEPSAQSLATAVDQIWEDPAKAERMGHAAFERYNGMNISWDSVLEQLLG